MWLVREIVELILLLVHGISELLRTRRDFAELEKGIFRLVQEVARRALVLALHHAKLTWGGAGGTMPAKLILHAPSFTTPVTTGKPSGPAPCPEPGR